MYVVMTETSVDIKGAEKQKRSDPIKNQAERQMALVYLVCMWTCVEENK